MLIRSRRGWELPESAATPERLVLGRRAALGLGAVAGAAVLGPWSATRSPAQDQDDPSSGLYPMPRNEAFALDRPLSPESEVTTFNNFYEFGSQKNIWRAAKSLKLRPWTVRIDGLVEQERTLGIDELLKAMPLEERLYRHRCVEAWAMAVPWSGFPLKALVGYARPLGSARYLRMETFLDTNMARGQRQFWYPWPYTEGLTMAEATNELAFVATGLYGRPMPRQNGAPLRLAVPWKYGFKSVKSIVRFHFTEERPKTFWETVGPSECGFWANVNPAVPHPRWSQAEERLLGSEDMVPTQLFNGYGPWVASLYAGLESEKLYI